MKSPLDNIRRLCDGILVAGLPPALRQTIDEALANGAAPKDILRSIQHRAGKRSYVALGVQAYLASKRKS
jgi:hypothetical protein